MNPSSISSSNAPVRIPRPTKPLLLAVAILAAVRGVLAIFGSDDLTYLDSRRTHSLFLNDLEGERRFADAPEVVVLGTSRTVPLVPNDLAKLLGLEDRGAIGLASAGADFLYMETVLRRNPQVLRNTRVVLIDVLPLQVGQNLNSDERGEFFLRFASFRQRLNARGVLSKLVGVGDWIVPARSHAQDPYQWRTGFARLGMSLAERDAYLRGVSWDQFDTWRSVTTQLAAFDRPEDRTKAVAELLFDGGDVLPNQVQSLLRIIEMTPEDCAVILVWLPFRDDVRAMVEESAKMTASRDALKTVLEDIDSAKVELHWFERPEDLGLLPSGYDADGSHFAREGIRRVTETYAGLARPHLQSGTTPE